MLFAVPSIAAAIWRAKCSRAFPAILPPGNCRRCRRSASSSTGVTAVRWRFLTPPKSRIGEPRPISALGAKLLAPENTQTLLVVGAGAMAPFLVRAHRTARPSLRRVIIWNRTAERAAALAASLCGEGIEAETTTDLDVATRAADVITTCTRAHAPLIKGVNLRPGTHLDLVGGYTSQTREADDEAARRARIFVDRRESVFHGVGDILQPIASGAITENDVLGDLYDLAKGAAGRRSASDITLFKNAGGGHLDLMTCEVVFERTRSQAQRGRHL